MSDMRLVEATGGKRLVVDESKSEGLMSFALHHEIKETRAFLTYEGPKIPKDEWRMMLSFFKWTYDKWKSESQVRLFVNLKTGTWKIWAFPQEQDTGMAAREVDNEAAIEQRKQFNEDWLYFGTVHHHCGTSAFQSGTDKANEEGQDGLHVTIGKMNEKKYDIHCRFYRKKRMFEPDMSWFWDIKEAIDAIPHRARKYLPTDFEDKTARDEMTEPSDIDFPQQWRDNIIVKPKPPELTVGFTGGPHIGHGSTYSYSGEFVPMWQRAKTAWEEIFKECFKNEVAPDELQEALDVFLTDEHPVAILADAMKRHKLDIDDLYAELHDKLEEKLPEDYSELALSQNSLRLDGKDEPPPKPKDKDIDTMTEAEWEAYMDSQGAGSGHGHS